MDYKKLIDGLVHINSLIGTRDYEQAEEELQNTIDELRIIAKRESNDNPRKATPNPHASRAA